MTSEILQLHIKSVEKQLCGKNMGKHVSFKAKDSRQRVWNVFLPLSCLHSMKHLSQFPLFLEPPFGLSANPFFLNLPHSDPADGNHMSV